MKKGMKIWQIGEIHINTNHLDVTDPGYDDDVWCRLHIKDMQPGTYNCVVKYLQEEMKTKQLCKKVNTVVKTTIYLADEGETVQRVEAGRSWRLAGVIGVDSGQAGFFPGHKPNFNDDEWEKLVDWMYNRKDIPQDEDKPNGYIRKFDEPGGESFWTASGYGDGAYPVYAIHTIINKKRMCTALEIRFME